jgi:hypothetical protein
MLNRRTVLALVSASLLAMPHLLSAQREVREQHVIVTVTTSQRTPVQGLAVRDFVVREDGVAREVLRVSPAPPPSRIVLLVDDSEAAQPLILDLRKGLATFVRQVTALRPAPLVMVMTFGERPTRQTPFTPRAAELDAAAQRIFAHPGAGAYFLDAVIDSAQTLQKMATEHPAIVAFTIESGPEFSSVSHLRVSDALKAAGATLWTLELQNGGPAESIDARERALVVGDVTTTSGGLNYPLLDRLAIEPAFASIATLLASGYDVVYARPDSLIPPARRTVETRNGAERVLASTWITP